MQFEPEIGYRITGGEPINKWLVAVGILKAPLHAKRSYIFSVDLPQGGILLQTTVEVEIEVADMIWHSSTVEWFGQVMTAGREEFESLHARGTFDLDKKEGSITFEPDPAFAEIAATSLW